MLIKRSSTDWLLICVLAAIAVLIYYPLYKTMYAYTDEVVQLWHYRNGTDFNMFVPQGRFITDKLFHHLFSLINTNDQIRFLRLFSLAGWIVSLPAWYFIVKKISSRHNANMWLPFFSTLYLICCPPFTVYVSWAACMELFLAATSGLIAGYFAFQAIYTKPTLSSRVPMLIVSGLLSMVSLFTYQSGFCCFLIPFALELFFSKSLNKKLLSGVLWYLIMYVLYYLLLKLQLNALGIALSERGSIYFNPLNKLKFVFSRALPSSLTFTFIFNEKSYLRLIISVVLVGTWVASLLFFQKWKTLSERMKYIVAVLCFVPLLYLPGIFVKENYASNRTLLALNFSIWLIVLVIIDQTKSINKFLKPLAIGAALILIVTAVYNFRKLFIKPVANEYYLMANFFEKNYKPGIDTVLFLRPQEDFFVRKYGITRSWDEFGVPSGFFDWVPEFQTKQWIYQITGDRALADKIVVKHTLDKSVYDAMTKDAGANTLLIDEETILK